VFYPAWHHVQRGELNLQELAHAAATAWHQGSAQLQWLTKKQPHFAALVDVVELVHAAATARPEKCSTAEVVAEAASLCCSLLLTIVLQASGVAVVHAS
jgi:hypothetical protein